MANRNKAALDAPRYEQVSGTLSVIGLTRHYRFAMAADIPGQWQVFAPLRLSSNDMESASILKLALEGWKSGYPYYPSSLAIGLMVIVIASSYRPALRSLPLAICDRKT